MPCRWEKRSGQRCASSNSAPCSKRARKPRGSSRAKARSTGSSSDTYGLSAKTARARVVFPDCLGPVMATTGKLWARRRRVSARVRGTMIAIYTVTIGSSICIGLRGGGSASSAIGWLRSPPAIPSSIPRCRERPGCGQALPKPQSRLNRRLASADSLSSTVV